MRHRIVILFGGAVLAGLFCAAWLLVNGPLAHLFRSPAESYLGILTIMIVCISLVTGMIVGAWDASKEEAHRKHLNHRFRPLLHH
jgi:hypothetical protein